MFIFFSSALVLVALLSLATYFLPGWSGELMAETAMLTGALVGTGYFGTLLGAWMFRERWAGSLVLSMRTTDQVVMTLVALASNGLTGVNLLFREGHRQTTPHGLSFSAGVAWLTLIAVLSACSLVFFRKIEVRDRGILHRGRLISWLNIERYEWEPMPGELTSLSIARPQKAVLRLHVARRFTFLATPRIRIGEGDREQLEMILNRHLSAWPE
jgi:hypothetical protein